MFRIPFILFITCFQATHSFSDIGKWNLPLNGEHCTFTLAKSLFKDSRVNVLLTCDVENTTEVTIQYQWAKTICSPDYLHYFEQQVVACTSRVERSVAEGNGTNFISVMYEETFKYTCEHYRDQKYVTNVYEDTTKDPNAVTAPPETSGLPLVMVDKEGIYILKMTVSANKEFKGYLGVAMHGPSGYLSAAIWPLLPFFCALSVVYAILCTSWMYVCFMQWRDLLRIQYWIGGVALLGIVESSIYYGIYNKINCSGHFSTELYMFAEFVSVAKRALARMLVIIVSLGFGIVKPRLGPALQRVAGTGALWALLAGVNAWLRLHHKAADSNRDLLLSEVPLSLLDSAICWWVFVSLAQTMRTLQLRRNLIKLSLYRHFTNTLIFAVISSVVFMLYSIRSYRVFQCITEWKEVWMDEAYWHILFTCVLTVIMVLWRPTNNNQRYAFTPLLDNEEDDEDEDEQFVNDAYGVKMRGSVNTADEKSADDTKAKLLEADLRWVEENIPSSTLPLLDSDEEIINTKFEVSKMQ